MEVISWNSKPPNPIPTIPSKPGKPSEFSPKPIQTDIPFFKEAYHKHPDANLRYLCKNGRLSEAVIALESISQRGSKVKPSTYISLLQSCIDVNSIQLGRKLHSCISLVEDVNPFVETKLVSMYAKCGSFNDARRVFEKMRERNLFTWSAMIGACCREQRWREVVELFFFMVEDAVIPDYFLFPKILQACGNCGDFETTKAIHSMVVKCGLSSSLKCNNSILAVYSKCGKLSWARRFFENMAERDMVTWNAIVSGYCEKGHTEEAHSLFKAMSEEGIEPGLITWNILIASYNQIGRSDVAMELMKKMESFGIIPDVYTWTSVISGFAQNNRRNLALDLFKEMLVSGVKPSGITIISTVSACASLKSNDKGKEIHSLAIKIGFIDDTLVGNSLIDMYSKCGELEAAQQVFDIVLEKDVYTWNSIIGGYCQAGYCGKAYELFMRMQESDVPPNVITWNVMISGYIKNGDEDRATDLFQRIEKDGNIKRNTASWNTLIAGYLQLSEKDKALGIFRQMQACGFIPNSVTILSVLPACANVIAAEKVKEIHCCTLRRHLESEIPVANSTIDSYAKSGNILYSRIIFNGMLSKDIITWNSVIAGYILHGLPAASLDLSDQMQKLGVKPNRGTFASIIRAYSLSGLVNEGKLAFSSIMEDYHIVPGLEHYAAMVDLYGRSGKLGEALEFIEDMPIEPDSSVWGVLLTACRNHKNVGLALHAGEYILDLEPANYVIRHLMQQAYAIFGKSEDISKLRRFEKANAITRYLGQCWIEINNRVYTFVAGDQSGSHLYPWIENLSRQVRKARFNDDLCIEEEENEDIIGFHSEKLAMAFALVGFTSKPQTIKIVKNLRMCSNCHKTAKYISNTYGCDIYLNDSKCLHHFSNGHCSCGDYW